MATPKEFHLDEAMETPDYTLGEDIDGLGTFSLQSPGDLEEWIRRSGTQEVSLRIKNLYRVAAQAEDRAELLRATARLVTDQAHNIIGGESAEIAVEARKSPR